MYKHWVVYNQRIFLNMNLQSLKHVYIRMTFDRGMIFSPQSEIIDKEKSKCIME